MIDQSTETLRQPIKNRSAKRVHEQTGIEFSFVPGGVFRMGADDGGEFERPVHEVNLSPYWMATGTITNRQFNRFVHQTGYRTSAEQEGEALTYVGETFENRPGISWKSFVTPDRLDHPAILVSWDDALAYCEWSNLRLPTEAEWEFAARGGVKGALYPWGNTEPTRQVVNFERQWEGSPPTVNAISGEPNTYGLYHIVGNVWQWCSDWYAKDAYKLTDQSNPTGPTNGDLRVRRGGSWNVIQAFRLRCANRGAMKQNMCALNVGFRCCLDD